MYNNRLQFFTLYATGRNLKKPCMLFLFILSIATYSITTKIKKFRIRGIFLSDLILAIFISINSLISISTFNLKYKKQFRKILKLIQFIDVEFYKNYNLVVETRIHDTIEFVLFQFPSLSFMAAESYIALHFIKFSFFVQYIPNFIILHINVIIMMQYNYFARKIKMRCQHLNQKLAQLTKSSSKVYNNINFFLNNYNRIYFSINLINQIFGIQILITFVIVLIFLIRAVNLSITNFLRQTLSKVFLYIFCSNLWGSFVFLVSIFFVKLTKK